MVIFRLLYDAGELYDWFSPPVNDVIYINEYLTGLTQQRTTGHRKCFFGLDVIFGINEKALHHNIRVNVAIAYFRKFLCWVNKRKMIRRRID